jgi:glycosyltransferase involved in cell wall biosynthesis
VDLFNPDRVTPAARQTIRQRLGIPAGATVVVFAGSFRRWHGIETLFEAARTVLAQRPDSHLLLVGAGERWQWAAQEVASAPFAGRVTLTGAVPYERVAEHLATADIAVAPFDTSAHAPLQAVGFYWSPLKVFEAMAMALPVVVPALPELASVARDGWEGLTYPAGDCAALSQRLTWLLDHPDERQRMGRQARARVVEHFSWQAHCRALGSVLVDLCRARDPVGIA